MFKNEIFTGSIRAVFLLFIAISANFLGNTLNCGLQFDLTTTPLLRNLFIYIRLEYINHKYIFTFKFKIFYIHIILNICIQN